MLQNIHYYSSTTIVAEHQYCFRFNRHNMWLCVLLLVATTANGFQLTVLHMNDFHVRFEQTNTVSGACNEKDSKDGKCYGGSCQVVRNRATLQKDKTKRHFSEWW